VTLAPPGRAVEAVEARPVSARQVARLLEACATAAAVASASELGVFALLDERPLDPGELATACGLSERGAKALLAALAALLLVERGDDGRYRAAACGLPGLAAAIASWGLVAPALRGEVRQGAETAAGAAALYPALVPPLGTIFAESAERAADLLTGAGLRVLDVAAGAAPWSIALARRDPGCRVTAVELPAVLPATRSAVRAAGLEPQFDFVAGDLFRLEQGAERDYDLVLAANLLHLFDEETNTRLVRQLAQALRRGGRIAIVDVVPNERRDRPRAAVLYGLGLLQRTATGTIYPYSAHRRWLADAGFERPRRAIGGPLPLTLITAALR
jgi:SAM-dependent methyltransferase